MSVQKRIRRQRTRELWALDLAEIESLMNFIVLVLVKTLATVAVWLDEHKRQSVTTAPCHELS